MLQIADTLFQKPATLSYIQAFILIPFHFRKLITGNVYVILKSSEAF